MGLVAMARLMTEDAAAEDRDIGRFNRKIQQLATDANRDMEICRATLTALIQSKQRQLRLDRKQIMNDDDVKRGARQLNVCVLRRKKYIGLVDTLRTIEDRQVEASLFKEWSVIVDSLARDIGSVAPTMTELDKLILSVKRVTTAAEDRDMQLETLSQVTMPDIVASSGESLDQLVDAAISGVAIAPPLRQRDSDTTTTTASVVEVSDLTQLLSGDGEQQQPIQSKATAAAVSSAAAAATTAAAVAIIVQ